MCCLDFVAIVAATGAIVNAWLHPDGLFEDTRDWLSVRAPAIVAQLASCRLCLSYHVAFWLIVLLYLPSLWLMPPWSMIVKVPIYSLAATRLSILIGLYTDRWGLEDDPENS